MSTPPACQAMVIHRLESITGKTVSLTCYPLPKEVASAPVSARYRGTTTTGERYTAFDREVSCPTCLRTMELASTASKVLGEGVGALGEGVTMFTDAIRGLREQTERALSGLTDAEREALRKRGMVK